MACRSCNNSGKVIGPLPPVDTNDWLDVHQVREICENCYRNMVDNNITRIRRNALYAKLREEMQEYIEVIYIGTGLLNLEGQTLTPFEPAYFDSLTNESLKIVNKDIKINKVMLDARPSPISIRIKAIQLSGSKGIIWKGAAPKRVNEHGTFVRGEPVKVSEASFDYLKTQPGFVTI